MDRSAVSREQAIRRVNGIHAIALIGPSPFIQIESALRDSQEPTSRKSFIRQSLTSGNMVGDGVDSPPTVSGSLPNDFFFFWCNRRGLSPLSSSRLYSCRALFVATGDHFHQNTLDSGASSSEASNTKRTSCARRKGLSRCERKMA